MSDLEVYHKAARDGYIGVLKVRILSVGIYYPFFLDYVPLPFHPFSHENVGSKPFIGKNRSSTKVNPLVKEILFPFLFKCFISMGPIKGVVKMFFLGNYPARLQFPR